MAELLTTKEAVKEWLTGDIGTNRDNLIDRLIASASTMILNHISRSTLAVAPYSVARGGDGRSRIILPMWPVVSVSGISVGGQIVAAHTMTGGVRGAAILDIAPYLFTAGAPVVVDYTAGWDEVPADIENACIETVGERFRTRERIGETSRSLNGATTAAYGTWDLNAHVKSALDHYVPKVPT